MISAHHRRCVAPVAPGSLVLKVGADHALVLSPPP